MPTASEFPVSFALVCSLRRAVWLAPAWVALAAILFSRSVLALGSPTDLQATEPTPDDISQAAKYFDQGRDAFRQENYVEAAEAFEKADSLAPNAKVLLLAIQSRELGGQLSRAATLAALAQQRHPKEPLFSELGELIKSARQGLHLIVATCEIPCRITVGDRLVHGGPATRRYLFLEEGSYRIRASWGEGQGLAKFYQGGTPGTRGKLHFEASRPAQSEDDWDDESGPADRSAEDGEASADDSEDWGDGSDWGAPPDEPPAPASSEQPRQPGAEGGADPLVFWSGVAVTGVLLGVSTWSGLYTLNNPGKDVVVAKCVGRGESCPEYQEGLANQLRTNVLWGITGGVGIATALIGAFWTDWDGAPASQGSRVKLEVHPLFAQAPNAETQRTAQAVHLDGSMITASGRF